MIAQLSSDRDERERLDAGLVCTFGVDAAPGKPILTFASSNEANQIVQEIVKVVGLRPNFEIRAAEVSRGSAVSNAHALIDRNKRYIVYNDRWVREMLKDRGSRWAGITLLAHECAHHLNGDTLHVTGAARHQIELDADFFAGFVVARLGGSEDDAKLLFQGLPEQGTATHPARALRLTSVAKGWSSAKGRPAAPASPAPAPPSPVVNGRTPIWDGPAFEADGKICRRVLTFDPPSVEIACKSAQGGWTWQ